jgi:cell division septation protein DedD
MDTPTKQRLVGAAVLIALAVIFLPMLVKGPAPDSGVSDVPLDIPNQPPSGMETRDLPLVSPQAGDEGALATPAPPAGERLPTVDTADAGAEPMQPPSVAGGDYAVHFGSYASRADAGTIVGQLRGSQLPGYSEQTTLNGRSAWRVRIGPYATRADAEAARLRAAHVRDDVGARVVVLDADAGTTATATTAPTASTSQSVAKPAAAAVTTEPLPAEAPAPKPATPPVATAPAETPRPTAPAPAPAASGTGFAVQVGAFGNATEAGKLRDRLRAAGFTAFTETVNSDKGALTRVRVGPVLSRADADQLRTQLSAKAGVSGIVRPHP